MPERQEPTQSQQKSGCSPDRIRRLVILCSWITCGCIGVLAVKGVAHLRSEGSIISPSEKESRFLYSSLCGVGLMLAAILFLSELKSARFFYLFGILRYRIARAFIYLFLGTSGLMISQDLNDTCNCRNYNAIAIAGACSLLTAGFQVLAICIIGNNATPITFHQHQLAYREMQDTEQA